MDRNLAIQYTAVAIIILAALTWLVVRFIKRVKNKSRKSCCGCVLPTNATLPTKITGTATTGNQQSVFIEDFFTSCQELTMFCHAIYAAGAIDAIGVI